MTELSRAIAIKPIITYPREALAGKTYLMTIDLQPEKGFEWQYEEEEYPVYCSVNSNLFSNRSVGEPVIVLHKFGGTYGSTKFLLTAITEEAEGGIDITLINKWGVQISVLHLSQITIRSLNTEQEAMAHTSRTSRIAAIIEQRKPLVLTLDRVRDRLSALSSALQQLQEYYAYVIQQIPNTKSKDLPLSKLQAIILSEIEEIKKIRNRFSRSTLNIGIIGRARQGKSRLIQSLTGLSSTVIPDGDRQHCTGVRSTIYHRSDIEPYAEVWLHSERSFLHAVIEPYYKQLGLASLPTTLKAFFDNPLPGLPDSLADSARARAMHQHLNHYRESLPNYQSLLDLDSPIRIPIDEIREFVAQCTADGESLFKYMAVKDIKIVCHFANEDIGDIALVDMPGLGDTGTGEEEHLLKVLSEDVDIALFVRMPKTTGDSWTDVDVQLYDLANQASLIPLSLWAFMVLNRTKGASPNQDNLRNCKDLAKAITTNHINVIKCIISDCSDPTETQRVLDEVLEYLDSNVGQIDQQILYTYQGRLRQLQASIDSELNNAEQLIKPPPSDFVLFENLVNKFWKALKSSLEKNLRDNRKKEIYCHSFSEQIKEKIAECESNFPIPSIESLEEWVENDSLKQTSYRKFLEQMRVQLSRELAKLDIVLAKLTEEMKDDIANFLIAQVKLDGLSDSRGESFLEELINLLPYESESLRHGFQTLSNFNISYSNFLQPRLRAVLTKTISELKQSDQISSCTNAQEIQEILRENIARALTSCREVLVELIEEPYHVFYAAQEEFIDHVVYAENAQSEWRIFLYENRYRIWDEFRMKNEITQLEQNWQQLITIVRTTNTDTDTLT